MKLQERTGKWIEMSRSSDRGGEITIHAPNSMWAAWQAPIYLREDDLAAFLRSVGWTVSPPSAQHT